jgi:hypothetical protein
LSDHNSLINLGELSKPANTLIEKIGDAVGGIFRPYQTRRMAEAEADAAITKAQTEIQVTDLHRRAMQRVIIEEAQRQENIENITRKALPNVSNEAKPENIETDWIANFFDKGRLVTDEDMQALWARVLAGEANSPGSHSKRTVSTLSFIDKNEAELFRNLCSFVWLIGDLTPIIFSETDRIYTDSGINFSTLQQLEVAGLITFGGTLGYNKQMRVTESPQGPVTWMVSYYGESFRLHGSPTLPIGEALLTVPGSQLALVAEAKPKPEVIPYVLERWKSHNPTPALIEI